MAPIVLQDALQAVHGVRQPEPDHEELRPPADERTSAHVLGR